MSYLIFACKPGVALRPEAHSVEAAAMAVRFFRARGWAVVVLPLLLAGCSLDTEGTNLFSRVDSGALTQDPQDPQPDPKPQDAGFRVLDGSRVESSAPQPFQGYVGPDVQVLPEPPEASPVVDDGPNDTPICNACNGCCRLSDHTCHPYSMNGICVDSLPDN